LSKLALACNTAFPEAIDKPLPNLPMLLRLRIDPTARKSKAEHCARLRTCARMLTLLPMAKRSRIEQFPLTMLVRDTLNELPHLEKPRTLRELPHEVKSKTETTAPHLVNDRIENELPMCCWFFTLTEP
jgi:hypothetical protein